MRSRSRFVTASDAGDRLVLSADAPVTASPAERTITGLAVPYGVAGQTSGGFLKFAKGSLTWSDPRRVKLLREHDQRDVVGYATELVDTDAGLVATFAVPEGASGDVALTEAANGLRDAFSVGVQLDDATLQKLRRAAAGVAVPAAGALREVSQVSVPAFDDARIGAAAAADLVVSAWTSTTTPASSATPTPEGPTTMTAAQRARLAELQALQTRTTEQDAELSTLTALAEANPEPAEPAQPAQQPADQGGQASASRPSTVPAAAGAAVVTGNPSTYRFDGTDSLVRDAYRARIDGDVEAADRVRRFNAELSEGNASSVAAFATAAATRDDFDTVPGVTGLATVPRPDLMREVVNRARPIVSKLATIPLTNAAPFAIPVVGEFTGVGPHTEGTPHRPAGTLTLGGGAVQPIAMSGAYEISRELVDAMNPAIDRIAARQMLRDYRRQSEGLMADLLNSIAPTVGGISDAMALRGAMLDAVNDDDEAVDVAWLSKGLIRTLALDVDGNDRPQLPFVGPSNAVGTYAVGSLGIQMDGTELYRSARLDADTGVLARQEGLLWGESRTQQFRFDEVLGPGVVKLALWGYCAAAVLDTADVIVVQAAPVAG